MFVMFFISALAETNRPPSTCPRRVELVAGYQRRIFVDEPSRCSSSANTPT
jgi:hypothetical protein